MAMNNGGPAFPIPGGSSPFKPDNGYDGMSLRDWFAGQALAGILANTARLGIIEEAASTAYAYADAMLAARQSDAEGEG